MSKARARITEGSIREWFASLKANIEEIGATEIFADPSRVYNLDETNIQLDPLTGKVVGIRGWRNIYEIGPGPAKSTLTFIGTFNARGDCVSPTLIYPYVRMPRDILDALPEEFHVATTESGWMTAPAFFEYLANAFLPWVQRNDIKMPVILFVDGHSTHLTLQTCQFCEQNRIILYLLPPNTTHILQPADVGPFKPMKSMWRSEIHNFQRENPNSVVRRKDAGVLLKKILKTLSRSSIVNGFKATGLYPFNPNIVDYSKCLDISFEDESTTTNVSNNIPTIEKDIFKTAIQAVRMVVDEDSFTAMDNGLPCNITGTDLVKLFKDNDNSINSNDSAIKEASSSIALPGKNNDINEPTSNNSTIKEAPSSIALPSENNIITLDSTDLIIHDIIEIDNGDLSLNIEDISLPSTSTTHILPESQSPTSPEPQAQVNENDRTPPYLVETPDVPDDIPPLIRQNAFIENKSLLTRSPLSPCKQVENKSSSKKNILDKHVFWEGKLQFKKRKTPEIQPPCLLSKNNFVRYLDMKAEKA